MLATGVATEAEFSATAKVASTMLSFWSAQLTVLGRSRIPGEPAGERMDSLD